MFGFPELLIAAALAQTPTPAAQVSLYRVDLNLLLFRGEQVSARAGSGSESNLEGYVWMDGTGCLTGAGSGTTAPPPMPGMRWHYTAIVTRQSGADITVDVTWQRVSEPAASAQHREVTLRPGETVTLEAIQVPASSACGITAARLSLSAGPATFSGRGGGRGVAGGMGAGGGVARGGVARGGVAGAGGMGAGGRSAGTASGGAGGRGMGGAAVAAGPRGAGGRGINVAESATTLARAMGSMNTDENGATLVDLPTVAYDAELWLVHTAPGVAAEETQRQSIHVSSSPDVVTFSPVSVQTAQGPASVEIATVVRALAAADGRPVLRVVIARVVGGAFNRVGSTTKVIASPAVGDVVSFEIPEWSGRARGGGVGRGAMLAAGGRAVTASASNDSLGGHQFSVRLRLKAKG